MKNEVVKKIVYDELVKKANAIQTTHTYKFLKTTDYYTKISESERKITDHDYNIKYIAAQEFNKSM